MMDQKFKPMIEKAAELGYQDEINYWGCSQAVVSALMQVFGIGSPDVLRVSTAFAAGVVRRGNVCGALSGGLIMIGFLVGRDDLEMKEQYQRGIDFGSELYRRFEEKIGSAICTEIQKIKWGRSFKLTDPEERELFFKEGAHGPKGCPTVTREGARLAAEIIVDILEQGKPLAKILSKV